MKKLKEGSEKEALYKIEFKKSAVKELEKLNPRDIPRIVDAIESLSTNPFPHYSKKIQGKRNLYRLRVGVYRIIYQVDFKGRIITIFYIRLRKHAYREL